MPLARSLGMFAACHSHSSPLGVSVIGNGRLGSREVQVGGWGGAGDYISVLSPVLPLHLPLVSVWTHVNNLRSRGARSNNDSE